MQEDDGAKFLFISISAEIIPRRKIASSISSFLALHSDDKDDLEREGKRSRGEHEGG